jgi:hypothetical protein
MSGRGFVDFCGRMNMQLYVFRLKSVFFKEKREKIGRSAKNHGLHSQLAFKGKVVGVKSLVTLEGQTPALNTKQTKKVNIVFARMG